MAGGGGLDILDSGVSLPRGTTAHAKAGNVGKAGAVTIDDTHLRRNMATGAVLRAEIAESGLREANSEVARLRVRLRVLAFCPLALVHVT